MASITLADAVAALAGPKSLGEHPEGDAILLHPQGMWGPYLKHRSLMVSLPKVCGCVVCVGCGTGGCEALESAIKLVDAKAGSKRAKG